MKKIVGLVLFSLFVSVMVIPAISYGNGNLKVLTREEPVNKNDTTGCQAKKCPHSKDKKACDKKCTEDKKTEKK